MEHIFGPEFEKKTEGILESLRTATEAAGMMLIAEREENWPLFDELAESLDVMITILYDSSKAYLEKYPDLTLKRRCLCLIGSLTCIRNSREKNLSKTLMKTEFEFIPVLEEAYMDFYFQAYIQTYPDREKEYYDHELYELASNKYINESVKTGSFKYDLSISVLAYNKLDYTKMCLDALLKRIPEGLNYELILWDNGSTDGTKEYFESIGPDKLIESRLNWGTNDIVRRIVQGRYWLFVSNDVIVAEHTIENLLRAIKEEKGAAKIVPATPHVSNLQNLIMLENSFGSFNEMLAFSERNNIYDPYRHEERVRLCDPIAIFDTVKNLSSEGICPNGYIGGNVAFPDDKTSLLLRRRGFKQYLSKDAFCWHFGSVTIKGELSGDEGEKKYLAGRERFKEVFGIDPWGTGFCFDYSFIDCLLPKKEGHTNVLGINCGLGSNSLRIKEQMKEYHHNTDCSLYNVTDNPVYLQDLRGIGEDAAFVAGKQDLDAFMGDRKYDFVVIEDPFTGALSFENAIDSVLKAVTEDALLFIKLNEQCLEWVRKNLKNSVEMRSGWVKGTVK